jgi:hypothetical protein
MTNRKVTDALLRTAREQFRDLLNSHSKESEWQTFFAQHPFVFSRALPIQVSPNSIVPLARPGNADPDFVFYQRRFGRIQGYGVIEIKRPDSRILTSPRKDLVLLTRDAATAVGQAAKYASSLDVERALVVGVQRHLFVIMGLSDELARVFASDVMSAQVERLSPDCQIIPFDEVLRRFEDTLPERLMVLAPSIHGAVVAGPASIALAVMLDQLAITLEHDRGWLKDSLRYRREELETFIEEPGNGDASDDAREVLAMLSLVPPDTRPSPATVRQLRRVLKTQKQWVLSSWRAMLAADRRRAPPDDPVALLSNDQLLYQVIGQFCEDTEELASFLREPYDKVKLENDAAMNLARALARAKRERQG